MPEYSPRVRKVKSKEAEGVFWLWLTVFGVYRHSQRYRCRFGRLQAAIWEVKRRGKGIWMVFGLSSHSKERKISPWGADLRVVTKSNRRPPLLGP